MSLDDGLRQRIFEVASRHLSGEEIFEQIQKWVRENRVGFLVQALENLDTSLSDISDALSRYHHLAEEDIEFSPYTRKNVAILLTQRLLTEHLELVNVAKDYVDIQDFYDILQRTIFPRNSHGKLGGKSTGLFLASLIVRKAGQGNPDLAGIRVPRTWYITSDSALPFRAPLQLRGRNRSEVQADPAGPAGISVHRAGLQERRLPGRHYAQP